MEAKPIFEEGTLYINGKVEQVNTLLKGSKADYGKIETYENASLLCFFDCIFGVKLIVQKKSAEGKKILRYMNILNSSKTSEWKEAYDYLDQLVYDNVPLDYVKLWIIKNDLEKIDEGKKELRHKITELMFGEDVVLKL